MAYKEWYRKGKFYAEVDWKPEPDEQGNQVVIRVAVFGEGRTNCLWEDEVRPGRRFEEIGFWRWKKIVPVTQQERQTRLLQRVIQDVDQRHRWMPWAFTHGG
jgi:hypothetical protein